MSKVVPKRNVRRATLKSKRIVASKYSVKKAPARPRSVKSTRAKPRPAKKPPARPQKLSSFRKHESNPIIEPREGNFWEMKATFNPAAMQVDGRVHLLYRAIGGNDMSVLGYAGSDDGVTFVKRPAEPAFEHRIKKKNEGPVPAPLPPITYGSGGGWNGGSEDPRLTLIDGDGRAYLTYTAFDGWGSVRIALTSISLEDFLHQRWNWEEPILLSPPGEIHKNWVLFPEKINGKYAILHGITPEILIDYVDSLDFDGTTFINSARPSNDRVEFRKGVWDSRVRGVGPPPIRTREGWLLLYHAVDALEPNRYKMGAMILDANDPTKILYRSQAPILEPEEWYENSGWKWGVIYSCGAVVKDGDLYVYYGGADSVVCVAVANLETFLDELKKHGVPKLIKKDKIIPNNVRR